MRHLVGNYGGYLLLDEIDLDRTQHWFERHGTTAVLIGRLIPGVRSLISIPAGIIQMPLGQFIVYTAIGSTIWNTVLITAGWLLGHEWDRVEEYTEILEYLVLTGVVLGVVWYVWRRRQRITG